jgi:hypothetical protein
MLVVPPLHMDEMTGLAITAGRGSTVMVAVGVFDEVQLLAEPVTV